MEAPLCRSCGQRHWQRVCYDVTETVTKPVTKAVTQLPVTEIVTPRQADLETDNRRLAARVVELEAEVKELKRALAGQAPLSAAERQRKAREKRKAKA